MLISLESAEYAKHINEQPCEICHTSHVPGRHVTLDEMEKNYILKVYESTGRQKKPTARILDIDVNTLRARIDRYGF